MLLSFQNEDPPSYRICYESMKHEQGDVVKLRDCIVIASGNRKKDLPFIAKVTALWENPNDGEQFCFTSLIHMSIPDLTPLQVI